MKLATLGDDCEHQKRSPQCVAREHNSVSSQVFSTLTNIENRFPAREGYTQLWEKRKEDGRFTSFFQGLEKTDGEIVYGKRAFSLLSASSNRKDIVDGDHMGQGAGHMHQGSDTGISGFTYISPKAVKNILQKNKKQLFHNEQQIKQFLRPFPGNNLQEKIFSLAALLELPFTGYYDNRISLWENVGMVGYIVMSDIQSSDIVYGIRWDERNAKVTSFNPKHSWIILAVSSVK